ncbi:MAG TPA: acyl-CoA dehydrogenase family protein [Gammaproteobacteria bacterium]
MDFDLDTQQEEFRRSVGKFAKRHLSADALNRAHAEEYPVEVARLMSAQGLLGIALPEESGGQGGTLMDAVLAIEAIAAVCPRSADVIQAGNFGAIRLLAEYADAGQRERFLKPLLAGDAVVAVGMTEPEAGSAVTDLKTTAIADGDGYRVNGTKVFTTHGWYADFIVAYVRFGPGVDGIGSVIIEKGMEGFRCGKPTRFMSGDDWAQLYFDDIYVDADHVLLGPGGFKKQIAGFNVERIGNSARALALGRFAFETARAYALERKQFDRPICEFQGIQWKFAEMKAKLDAAQLLLYRAATRADKGLPSAADTAIAKLSCNQAGFDAASESLQVMAGAGFSQDSLVEYCFRRTRGWMIAGGSLEMMKNRIAESVFERRFRQRP